MFNRPSATVFIVILILAACLVVRHIYRAEKAAAGTKRAYLAHLKAINFFLAFPPVEKTYINDRGKGQLSVGIVSDSIGWVYPPSASEVAAQTISLSRRWREVLLTNAAVGSSDTADWLPGSKYPLLERAESAFASHHVSVVLLTLGTNDAFRSRSPRQYLRNLTQIVGDLNRHGWVVIINESPAHSTEKPPLSQDLALDNTYLAQYQPEIAALCNGKTVLLGDTNAYGEFIQHPALLVADHTHPNLQGRQILGRLWAAAAMRQLRIAAPSSIPTHGAA